MSVLVSLGYTKYNPEYNQSSELGEILGFIYDGTIFRADGSTSRPKGQLFWDAGAYNGITAKEADEIARVLRILKRRKR
jgi:hypothetical protein